MTDSNEYETLDRIGQGSFGVIRKVRRKSDGRILCRKEIHYKKMSVKERAQLHAEFSILNSLHHPNIVGYEHREHFKDKQELHLYMEYCGNGDLGQYITKLKNSNQYAEEDFVWGILAQLLTALYRCHYGEDAPEVGSNVYKPAKNAKPMPKNERRSSGQVVIIHRDLKPENVFLGEENSVKLGDFGLSKIMQSHDFASTYVGTPFYMSPEICGEERYSLKSDIWSLGCIIYELCARKPPFNAKTHLQLIKNIKYGMYEPLPPALYSAELSEVIRSCLKVNPLARPDTAELLDHPAVRLMRKEREVIDVGIILKHKEQLLSRKTKEQEVMQAAFSKEKDGFRSEIESVVRREWEVKARLEIDRQIQIEKERLAKTFEDEVHTKVQAELQKHRSKQDFRDCLPKPLEHKESLQPFDEVPRSSVSSDNDNEFPSSTDLTSLSLESPVALKPLPPKKTTRTPFGRAQTMFVDSPADVQMADPSPISIASLALSPRRNGPGSAANVAKKLFSGGADKKDPHPLQNALVNGSDDDDDGIFNDVPSFHSPTQEKSRKALPPQFRKPARPGLVTQKTAPLRRPASKPNLFAAAVTTNQKSGATQVPAIDTSVPPVTATSDGNIVPTADQVKASAQAPLMSSPSRRLSKIPSATSASLAMESSPIRRSKSSKALLPTTANHGPLSAQITATVPSNNTDNLLKAQRLPPSRPAVVGQTIMQLSSAVNTTTNAVSGRPMSAGGVHDPQSFSSRADAKDRQDVPVWPDDGEMPSPFIVRAAQRGTMRFR